MGHILIPRAQRFPKSTATREKLAPELVVGARVRFPDGDGGYEVGEVIALRRRKKFAKRYFVRLGETVVLACRTSFEVG